MYRLSELTVDPACREIRSGDRPVPVEPLVFDLVVLLIANRDRVVGKDELVERLWDGRAISESTLTTCVKAARRALGDDGRTQAMIRTLHRRGVRFVGAVEEIGAAPISSSASDTAADADPAFGIDLSLPERPSVAVLPFEVPDGDAGAMAFARGLVRDITLGLARTRWLFVTAEASANRYQPRRYDPQQVGASLGVRYLLTGTLMRHGPRLRITVTVIDASAGAEVWAERFDRTPDDVFTLLDEIASVVVAAAGAEINQQERRRAIRSAIEQLDAWGAYHAALDLLNRFEPQSFAPAEALLERAAALDPGSGHIWAARSFLFWQRAFLEFGSDRAADLARARDLAIEAVGLDPLDAHAHWALGRAEHLLGDTDMAAERFIEAVELNPSFSLGHYNLAWTMRLNGNAPRGLAALAEARRLSPHDPLGFAFIGLKASLHFLAGESEAAADWARRAVRQPYCHYHNLAAQAFILFETGHADEALALASRVRLQRPDYDRHQFMRTTMMPASETARIATVFETLGLA